MEYRTVDSTVFGIYPGTLRSTVFLSAVMGVPYETKIARRGPFLQKLGPLSLHNCKCVAPEAMCGNLFRA